MYNGFICKFKRDVNTKNVDIYVFISITGSIPAGGLFLPEDIIRTFVTALALA